MGATAPVLLYGDDKQVHVMRQQKQLREAFLAHRKAQDEEQKREDLERAEVKRKEAREKAACSNLANAPWLSVSTPTALRSEPVKQRILVQPTSIHAATSSAFSCSQMPTPASTPIPSPSPPPRVRPAKITNPLLRIRHTPRDVPINRPISTVKKTTPNPRGPMPLMSKRTEQAWTKGSTGSAIIKVSKPLSQYQLKKRNRILGKKVEEAIGKRDELREDLGLQQNLLADVNQKIKEISESPLIQVRRLADLRKEKEGYVEVLEEIKKRLDVEVETITRYGGDKEEEAELEEREREQRIALHMRESGAGRKEAEQWVYRAGVATARANPNYREQRDILLDNGEKKSGRIG